MGRLTFHPVKQLKEIFNLETMIETGTEHGYGVFDAQRAGFKRIISCEMMEYKFKYSVDRFVGQKEIELLLGKSEDLLPEMIKRSRGNILFWLDAHLPYEEGKRQSEKDVEIETVFPVFNELSLISKVRNNYEDVIIIDDAILFLESFRKKKFGKFDLKRFSNKDKTIDVSVDSLKEMFPDHRYYLCEAERGSLIIVPFGMNIEMIAEQREWIKI